MSARAPPFLATFGGTPPKPEFHLPPTARPSADDGTDPSFGWSAEAPAGTAPGSTPLPDKSPLADGSNDGFTPIGGMGDTVMSDRELLLDDDSRWRTPPPPIASSPFGGGGGTRNASDMDERTLIARSEAWLKAALEKSGPSLLMRAIRSGGCNALSGGIKCVMCGPKGPRVDGVSAYYRAQTSRVLLCADRLHSEEQLSAALTHELVHAYDHCRKGMRIPGVRTQIPWALDCPTEACTEVRAYSMATFADTPSWVDKRGLVYGSALQSLMSNPGSECARAHPGGDGAQREASCRAALDACFERCLADVAPFSAEGRAASEKGTYPEMRASA
mmetsp:Transcript_5004/g.12896  ORF Transcript_5004/g.12896 Transcript_5004/m.12896 type:complete len:332 (-) Transcript_5004:122-1117(-)